MLFRSGSAPPIPKAGGNVDGAVGQTPQSTQAPSVNKQLDDTWGSDEEHSDFVPRNPALDQLPTQFAQGPVAPPVGQIPQAQIPQSSGIGRALLSAFI